MSVLTVLQAHSMLAGVDGVTLNMPGPMRLWYKAQCGYDGFVTGLQAEALAVRLWST